MIFEMNGVSGGDPVLQEKTVTPTTSQQTVTPDADYDGLSQVTVNAMPTATQATPSITVSAAGLITASATQTAGYVAAGTKSATKQLTVQAAKTVTPTTSNQTAVASGRYTTGAVTVKGDSNLKAANIAKGVSIFGVTGTYAGAPVLLWTNASPTSEFGWQTVTVTKGYSAYLIEYRYSTSYDYKGVSFVPFNSEAQLSVATMAYHQQIGYGSYQYTAGRYLVAVSDGSIAFGFGFDMDTGSSSLHTQANGSGIPTRIWGIKWTL